MLRENILQGKYLKPVLALLLVIGVVAALGLNYYRVKAEQGYKTVEILVDYDELKTLAEAQELPLGTVATRFREAGATGVLVRERTVQDLEESGELVILKGNELALQQSFNPQFLAGFTPEREQTYLLFQENAVENAIENAYTLSGEVLHHLQFKKAGVTASSYGDWQVIGVPGLTLQEQEKLGIGFPHHKLQEIKDAGLTVVPRVRSWAQPSIDALEGLATSLGKIPGLSMVTFNDEVLPGSPVYLAEQFKDLQIPVGLFEFYAQQGLNQLAVFMEKNAVRVHCIGEDELRKFNEQTALARYGLAVSERNIRVLYVRLFGMQQPDTALARGIDFIGQVKEKVQAEGFTVGPAGQLPSLPYSRYLILAVGLGVIGGVMLLLRRIFPPLWTALFSIAALVGWAGLLYLQPLLARKAFALLATILFPIVGVITFVRAERRTVPQTVVAFLQMTGLSFLGAILMTGLLADKSFLLKLDQFSGVKLAHLLPLIVIPLYFFWQEYADTIISTCRKILTAPLLVWYALAAGFILAVLVVYLLRTGNDAPALVSSLEIWLRDTLDQLLGVRPRTKEFLIGHPAMLLLLYYGYKWPRLPLLLLGVIGQISLVNTYAHLHTPVLVSLVRSFHGLWLGLLLGVAAILAMSILNKWLARRLSANG